MTLHFLLCALLGLVPAAAESATPYNYRIWVETPDYRTEPDLRLGLRIESYRGGFIMRPRVEVRGGWSADACGDTAAPTSAILANDGTRWEDTFILDCSGLRRASGGGARGASWRVVFVDRDGRSTRPRLISASIESSRPVPTVFQNRKRWALAGSFAADAIEMNLEGGRVVDAIWESDPDEQHRPASHRLRVVVDPSTAGDTESRGGASPEPTEPEPGEWEREMSTELTALSLELAGSASTHWPDLVVWLRPARGGAWQRIPLGARDRSARSAMRIEIPEELVGVDLEAQVTSLSEEYLDSLRIIDRDGAPVYRLHIATDGPAIRRLRLERPVRPNLVITARVVDPDGRSIPDATVAVRSFDERRHRRGLLLVESTSVATDEMGEAVLKLWDRPGDQIWITCAKPGWTVHGQEVSRKRVECRLEPAPAPPSVIDVVGERPPFGVVRVVDKNGGAPIHDATVRWTWRRGEAPIEAVGFGHGLWGVPTPDPMPERAQIAIDAPCYQPVRGSFSPFGAKPAALSYVCRTAKLSIRLVGAGPGVVIRNAQRATAIIRQGARKTTLAFSRDGYSEAKGFRFDPTGGPVEIEVRAPGFAAPVRRIDDLGAQIDENGYVPDIEIALRPAGRGLAVLINAAETWTFYAPARDAAIRALGTSVAPSEAPDHLVVGVLGGARERASFDDAARLADMLRWFGGMSASGGRLLAENLGQRLDALASTWPTASSWDLVVVVPHDALAGTTTERDASAEHVAAARPWLDALRAQHVVLHMIEDGGTNPVLRAFAEHLGGTHITIDSTDPKTARETIREHLASVSTAPRGE